MSGKLRLQLSMSMDGYSAGPNQSREKPLGEGGESLFRWAFVTRTMREQFGQEGGETGLDNDRLVASRINVGATIMGRNMFGPVRGDWPDESWRGWWGPNPPYHTPVFVLTHYAREPLEMEGGTTFYFITDGIESALEKARAAAGERDVVIGGGAQAVQQYLRAGLVDEMEIHVSPVLMGRGERLLDNVGDALSAFECTGITSSGAVAHFTWVRH